MIRPNIEQFGEFYAAVNGYAPFPWQSRLANSVCNGIWPHAIALPTAAGKTGCIDIALFALACGAPKAARRVFFVVDRRIVVDQAFEHAKHIASILLTQKTGILKLVAESLRELAHDERPLDVYVLRGGMYRESAWTRSPLQPTIIASTVDQVGSRLLFRGYGVSDSMKPIHAGLVGNDSLILLDEAHCARPFDQTMQSVKIYRAWHDARTPFTFVSISATPSGDGNVMRADEADDAHPVLGQRMEASKPAALVVAEKAKGKNGTAELAKVLKEHAISLSEQNGCVGIIVNRVKTARHLRNLLKAQFGEEVVLLTGRMRPLDRDRIFEDKLRPLLSNAEGTPPKFVIGTQCLECGADFDFHALVTECASLDALRQRFGRLNRVAKRPTAKAVIVIRGDQIDATEPDAVYGESLSNTWKWLSECASNGIIDFGIAAMKIATDGTNLEPLNAPTTDAPVLFPAHLDCWVQTHPIPTPDPDPALFLHGPNATGQPDVQVVFRSDLGVDPNLWTEIVSLCPPSTSEAVAVPISVFKKWLAGDSINDQTSDVQGEAVGEDDADDAGKANRTALCWLGPVESSAISNPKDVRPDHVFVVPCDAPDVGSLADFITETPNDYAEEAFLKSRDKAMLRLPDLVIDEEDEDFAGQLTDAIRSTIAAKFPTWNDRIIDSLTNEKRRVVERFPDPIKGYVVFGKSRLHQFDPTYLDDSEPAESYRGRSVTLDEHSLGVAEFAKRFANGCGLDGEMYFTVGLFHDIGKLDPRFQAMLKQSSPRTVVGKPLAKSAKSPRTLRERDEARLVHHYPKGARHELLSTAMFETITSDDLPLFLTSSHHGSGRPFANAVDEIVVDTKRPFEVELFGQKFKLASSRQDIAAWNANLPERFWRMVRKLGWWGTAYHEAVFRLADHAQSRWEQENDEDKRTLSKNHVVQCAKKSVGSAQHTLALTGLDGSNPLAFLAALGTLMVCDQFSQGEERPDWLTEPVRLSWGSVDSPYTPVLHLSSVVPSTEAFAEFLANQLPRSVTDHPAEWVVRMLERGNVKDALRDFDSIKRLVVPQRAGQRAYHDWITALSCESAIDADSQLQTVRCDYLIGNMKSLMRLTQADHILRSLFAVWDYADGLANQSLHWEPTEDRRHAYQWHTPSGDPTRKRTGGMLGANRLALEAWSLFPSFPDPNSDGERVNTRGFRGNRANNTFWTWPLWNFPATRCRIESLMSLKAIQSDVEVIDTSSLRQLGVTALFRLQRILVGKTPNFTTAVSIA